METAALAVGAAILALPLVFLVPPGEAPDEHAHLAYVRHVVREGTLPPVPAASSGFDYEFHQPPLAYAVTAATLRAFGFDDVDYPFEINPRFDFQRGQRVFLDPSPVPAGRRGVFAARAVNVGWLLLMVVSTVLVCRRLSSSPRLAAAGAVPFCWAPQLLFASATAGNDAAVIALTAVATWGLVVLSESAERPGTASTASVAAGLAVWAKVSALLLAPAVGLVAWGLARSRRWRTLTALLAPGLALAALWLALELARTSSVAPDLPTGWHGQATEGLARLVTEPKWVIGLWGSFWAKLGWFNLPLPWPVYAVFLPATAAVASALVPRGSVRRVTVLLAAIAGANFLLVLVYMVRVDWQPQGRYLLPSAAALAGLCTLGFERWSARFPAATPARIAFVSVALALAAVISTYRTVAVAY